MISLAYPSKPSAAIRAGLKAAGFRWNRLQGCWQRPGGDEYTAGELAHRLDATGVKYDDDEQPDRFDMDYEDSCARQCGL